MRLDPTKLSSIKVGMIVEILDLDDKITEGEITHIISKYDNVEGIVVKLKKPQNWGFFDLIFISIS